MYIVQKMDVLVENRYLDSQKKNNQNSQFPMMAINVLFGISLVQEIVTTMNERGTNGQVVSDPLTGLATSSSISGVTLI